MAGANHMRPALSAPGTSHWDHKDYQRALQRRRTSARGPAASPGEGKDARVDRLEEEPMERGAGCCDKLRELASVLMPLPAREVVLQQSTKLTWADSRFNSIGELAPSAARGLETA